MKSLGNLTVASNTPSVIVVLFQGQHAIYKKLRNLKS
jgi:hypothetical protein